MGFALCAAEERTPVVLWTGGSVELAGQLHCETYGGREKLIADVDREDGSADKHGGSWVAAGVCGGLADFGAVGRRGRGAGACGRVAEVDCGAEGEGWRECRGFGGACGDCTQD